MQTGTKISLIGHGALISWALVGGIFRSAPDPVSVQEVAVISLQDFERLNEQVTSPDVVEAPETPQVPATVSDLQVDARPPDDVPGDVLPEAPVKPEPDPLPEPVEPDPEPEIQQVVPEVSEPQLDDSPLPQLTEPEVGRAIDRVAPTPIAEPEPDVAIDDVTQDEITPEAGADEVQPAQEATAQEAASDRTVTEAEAQSDALSLQNAPRPRIRPKRPTPVADEPKPEPPQSAPQDDPAEAEPTPSPAPDDAAIEQALQDVLGQSAQPAEQKSGPPLTSGEKEGLRVAVSQCWNVGALSSAAQRVTVVVALNLTPDGKPVSGSLKLASSEGGDQAAANQAYQAARRAILRCGSKGFDLPADKYEQWRDIEMTFNPERIRNK